MRALPMLCTNAPKVLQHLDPLNRYTSLVSLNLWVSVVS